MSPHRLLVNAEQRSYFVVTESDKESQLYDLRLLRILARQYLKGLAYLNEFVIIRGSFDGGLIQFHPLLSAPAFDPQLAARILHENPSHRLCGRSKKVSAALPGGLGISSQPEPCFMNEGRWLESLSRRLARHLCRRDLTQLGVNQWQQIATNSGIAFLEAVQDTGKGAQSQQS